MLPRYGDACLGILLKRQEDDEFKISLGYTVRPCLKIQTKREKERKTLHASMYYFHCMCGKAENKGLSHCK
jgi:hypothetical protein